MKNAIALEIYGIIPCSLRVKVTPEVWLPEPDFRSDRACPILRLLTAAQISGYPLVEARWERHEATTKVWLPELIEEGVVSWETSNPLHGFVGAGVR